MEDTNQIRIRTSRLRKLRDNNVATARAANLKYVADTDPGIKRIKEGEEYTYTFGDRQITDERELARIQKLAIPPAWVNVWICSCSEGHLQATGLDSKNRKQYRYHALWNNLRNYTKFSHLYDFGNALPLIRQRIQTDLLLPGLPLNKVLATIVALMQYTNIRVGNDSYEKLYGSFGLTTLKDKHVNIDGGDLTFMFKGKKGIYHDIKLHSSRLAKIVRQCKEIPGKELFQYYDETKERKSIDSGMVNNYIREICNAHFTSKDFRTWAGTLCAVETFNEIGYGDSISETKKKIIQVLDIVAKKLGNTRNVCRKYYIHPGCSEYVFNSGNYKVLRQNEAAKTADQFYRSDGDRKNSDDHVRRHEICRHSGITDICGNYSYSFNNSWRRLYTSLAGQKTFL